MKHAPSQPMLWGNEPSGLSVARARASDPVTSHEAAQRVNNNGTKQSHCQRILDAIRDIPGRTAAELAEALDLKHEQVARRCPNLAEDGLARVGEKRKCRVNKTSAQTWFPVYRGDR